jgi:pimeloyl-ACP methyl ester carboxylesterase
MAVAPSLTFKDRFWHRQLGRPYRLNVHDHGDTGPVLILLHGLASSSATWDGLIPLLKDQYRCISIDLLGFGDSPKPQWYSYTIEEHIRAIEVAVNRLRLRQPFTLVGHSMGSLLATRFARLHPKRVGRLVLLSPPVYPPLGDITNRAARNRTSMYLRAYRFLRTHKRATLENVVRLSRILPQTKSMVIDRPTWIPFMRSLEQCVEHQTLISDIRVTHAPTDIFYGNFDEVIVPYNVRQLTRIREVTLHPLAVNHVVGKRYATAVARVLAV